MDADQADARSRYSDDRDEYRGYILMLGLGFALPLAPLRREYGSALAAPDWDFTSGVKTGLMTGSGDVYVIYGGWNLRLSTAGTVEALVASAVSALPGGSHYLVIGVPTFDVSEDYAGADGHEAVLTINAALDDLYGIYWGGGNYVDFREHFVNSYSPVSSQDVIDFGRDIIPASMRDSATAFSSTGISSINAWIASIFTEKGW